MARKIKELGIVALVQLQPSGLIVEKDGGYYYDEPRRVVVDELMINSKGIEATTPGGEHVLDIHHLDHPDKEYDDDDLVCIGFTSHYDKMQERFGEHMVYGVAGENIIINFSKEIWLDDLGEKIAFEDQDSGELLVLKDVQVAHPCEEFSHYAAKSQDKKLPHGELKEILEFLGKGRRGYLLVLEKGQAEGRIRPGDKVFVVD